MRICLYWNPSAGNGVPLESVTAAIGAAGHDVIKVIERNQDAAEALSLSVDAVVAAGGDGTVARVGRALAGTELPLAILPLGTANNIATSLGVSGDVRALADEWGRKRIVKIDVGVVADERGEHLFVEGVGTGLVPKGIAQGRRAGKHEAGDAAAEVDWARDMFSNALAALQPQWSRLCIDGEVVEGDYLLVEILNIASVGPRLRLSAETTPADGLMPVVIASESDREAIAEHLRLPWEDDDNHAWLKSWRATRVEVSGWHEYHVDDRVRTSDSGHLVVTVRPGPLAGLA